MSFRSGWAGSLWTCIKNGAPITLLKPYKQQLTEAKSARIGINEQKTTSPKSRAKRRTVVLRAFVPPVLGWPAARWEIVGKYLNHKTAQARADELAQSDAFYKYATSWTVDAESYVPSTLDISQPTLRP